METPPADVTIVKGMGAVFFHGEVCGCEKTRCAIQTTIIFTGRARGVYDDNTKRSA